MSERVRRTVEVPGYSGRAVEVAAGERVRVTDLEGAQIGDLFAIGAADHHEYLNAAETRLINDNLFPRPGQAFYSTLARPILTFLEDHSPGPHDMLYAPCDRAMYERRGLLAHPNCRDNYLGCAEQMGLAHRVVPDPVNLFQNTPPQPDGTLAVLTTASRPGDNVLLRAEMDIILILTACSSERINGGRSTPLRIEVFADR